MTHLLHIDSSSRAERSYSRALSNEFIQAWKTVHPSNTVTYRDLGHDPLPYVDENWIAAAYASPGEYTPEMAEAIKLSDSLVDEFLAADRYVFGIPMHNFSIPSVFKTYIDQIVRVNRTFSVDDKGYKGLVEGDKKMLIVTPRSGTYRPERPTAQYDFHEPYLRTIFGFIGITDITFIYAEGLAFGEEARRQSLAAARAALQEAVGNW